ncbi:MAG: protein-tyrosine phosphatase family protein [Roseovarius sp.]
MTEFVIHALHVGGGTLALAPLPGASGDYGADMAHLRDWKPALVITLVTPEEIAECEAFTLGTDLQEAGTRWISYPIQDFGTPAPDQFAAWPDASEMMRAALKGGGRVMIHCNGGCGRSGMVALRLMVETGEAPDAALDRLRAVRPGAVETAAQMAWARRG